jgi:sec-independent protein translocase protein TatB
MFDISWSELLVIAVIAVFVVGPKDIPKIMYQLGRLMRRMQYMRFAMSQQFDEILKVGDIEELRKGVNFEAPKTDEKSADEDVEEIFVPESLPQEEGLIKQDANKEEGGSQ